MDQSQLGELNWRLSAHPITLLIFLAFRIGTLSLSDDVHTTLTIYNAGSLLMYLFGVLFISNLYVPCPSLLSYLLTGGKVFSSSSSPFSSSPPTSTTSKTSPGVDW